MENAEEVFHFLEEFSKRKPKSIPQELNDYLAYVARTGDHVFQWSHVKCLFKEKLMNVITDFYETSPGIDIPSYPNVDPFNYDVMKNSLLERFDSFSSAPFTIQRICELLTCPRKQYNRIDKFMRAIEKNILVVSTREPGVLRHIEPENGEPVVNGSDNNSEYNVDVEMEDMSWKENAEQQQNSEPQPGSSDAHISVDDTEARLQAKQNAPMESAKVTAQSVTQPEPNIVIKEIEQPVKPSDELIPEASTSVEDVIKTDTISQPKVVEETKDEEEEPKNASSTPLVIPEIKIEDAEMTEQRLIKQSSMDIVEKIEETPKPENTQNEEEKEVTEVQQSNIDDSSSDSATKEETETKLISEVSTSSEESSSSSDNVDGNSNSPKNHDQIDIQEESSQSDSNADDTVVKQQDEAKEVPSIPTPRKIKADSPEKTTIESENYSISDVSSVLQQPQNVAESSNTENLTVPESDKSMSIDPGKLPEEEQKTDNSEQTKEFYTDIITTLDKEVDNFCVAESSNTENLTVPESDKSMSIDPGKLPEEEQKTDNSEQTKEFYTDIITTLDKEVP